MDDKLFRIAMKVRERARFWDQEAKLGGTGLSCAAALANECESILEYIQEIADERD